MIVLDTHAFLWMVQDSPRLSRAAREAVRGTPASQLGLSAASLFEIAWLVRRRRISLHEPIERFLSGVESDFPVLPLNSSIAAAAAQLPAAFPSDPFDRIIAATAIVEGVPLVTADQRIRRSKAVQTIW
ncbi:MAG: type II toxin-antitoxin system VapC family toxin [Acidobacteriaceae bacterium]